MNIVVGPCKCGGYGQCYDDDAEKEIGRCHDELGAVLDQGRMGEGEMSEWIQWNGGECPVAGDVLVETKLRNGEPMRLKASHVFWGELGALTVVAYRVAKEPIADVSRQDHYTSHTIQPIEYIVGNGMDFLAGNVVKYVTRYKAKNGIEDLKKARVYLNWLIEREESGTITAHK